MKNNIITIIKKEFVRFFGDKRLFLTTVLLPGIMIYVLYSFMGQGMMSQFETEDDYVYQVYIENEPETIKAITAEMPLEVTAVESEAEADDAKTAVQEKEADLLLVFPTDFDEAVAAYDTQMMEGEAPQIQMYYNSTRTESDAVYRMMTEVFDSYESMLANKFDVNGGEEKYDMASDKDATGMFFSMMLPMLMMMFLYSGCMAIAPESIAGEKERGTIATLLVTPMKRGQLAIGKIISLGVIGLLSGLSSFIGTMLSLPNLMGAASENMTASAYEVMDYIMLLFVILATVLVMVAAMSVISAFAKSVKEASTSITPLMIVILVVAVGSMIGDGAPTGFYWYLIPFYNSVQCMNAIFAFAAVPANIIVTVAANLVYTVLLAAGLAKIFDSEKIMYL